MKLTFFQFFLSQRAIYFLLWNTRQGFEHAGLDFWLSSIKCHAPKAPIFVVATHADLVNTITYLLKQVTFCILMQFILCFI